MRKRKIMNVQEFHELYLWFERVDSGINNVPIHPYTIHKVKTNLEKLADRWNIHILAMRYLILKIAYLME